VRLADLHTRVGRYEDALDALHRALQINPLDVGAYDLQALALAQLRRFAAAEQACHPQAFGAHTPLELLARAPWVQALRGDLSGAIARMQQIVDAHPDFVWGWRQLVIWLARMAHWDEALQAAERIAWLEPHNAQPLRMIGDLKLERGDRAGAAEAFRRAMRLEPVDAYAGLQLVGILRAERDYEGARHTLGILRQFAARDELLAAEAELAVAQKDLPTYLARLRELCGDADGAEGTAVRAIDAPVPAYWRRDIERALKEVLGGAAWNPITPMLWVRVRAHQQRFGGRAIYRWLASLGEPGKRAIDEVLLHIGEAVKRSRSDEWWIKVRLRSQLRLIRHYCRGWESDDRYWGQFGYALTNFARPRWAARWLSDWATRSNVEPWMVQNLVSALLSLHRGERARAVLRTVAANLGDRKDLGVVLGIWCVIGACIDGDVPLAERLLQTTPRDLQAEKHWALVQLATTLVAVCGDRPERASLSSERATSLGRAAAGLERSRDSRYLARLAMLTAARHVRHPWRILAAWWRLYYGRVIFAAVLAWLALVVVLNLGPD